METDFEINDQSAIITITPMTEAAQQWLDDNVQAEGWQYLGGSLYIDHRYADDILCGIAESGFTLR